MILADYGDKARSPLLDFYTTSDTDKWRRKTSGQVKRAIYLV